MGIRPVGRVSVLVIAPLLFLAGCSENLTSEVTGSIQVDGMPVEKGSISFMPDDGNGVTGGGTIVNGKYTATKVSPGLARVEIRVPKVVGAKKLYDDPNSPSRHLFQESLPKKYHETTELRFEVQPGRNEKNWSLTTR